MQYFSALLCMNIKINLVTLKMMERINDPMFSTVNIWWIKQNKLSTHIQNFLLYKMKFKGTHDRLIKAYKSSK
jgi:hypothetical protein